MRQEAQYFGEREADLVYIARKLKEALAVEAVLTQAGIDYGVQPDTYKGGVVFQTERVGAFFYVLPEAGPAAREALKQNGYRPQEAPAVE